MDIVVDIQRFRGAKKKFIPKEVAVVAIDTPLVRHWIMRPPYPFNRLSEAAKYENSWLTWNYHGIDWYAGEDEPECFTSQLREITRSANNIYVYSDNETTQYLQNLLARNIYNLESISPEFKFHLDNEEQGYCSYHESFVAGALYTQCAHKNAYKLKRWILERYTSENRPSINIIQPTCCSSDENWETCDDSSDSEDDNDSESDCGSGIFDENVNENTDVIHDIRKTLADKENKTKIASTVSVEEEEEEELSKLESSAKSSGKNNAVATVTIATQTDNDNSTANFVASADTLTLPTYTRVRSSTEKDELSRNFESITTTPCRTCGGLSCRQSAEGVDEVDGYRG